MPIKKKSSPIHNVDDALGQLKRLATKKTLAGMARYGIPSHNAIGVAVGDIQRLGKKLGRDHELAAALWETKVYEGRMLAAFVDEPDRLTPAQMDRWCRDFDSWAIVDTVCFKLFDQSPFAMAMVKKWASRKPEFEKRAAFALLACVSLHAKQVDDEAIAKCLPLIEQAATDDRNFVKKGVSWALRSVGRRSPALNSISVALAEQLAGSKEPAARWIGKDALRDLAKVAARNRAKRR